MVVMEPGSVSDVVEHYGITSKNQQAITLVEGAAAAKTSTIGRIIGLICFFDTFFAILVCLSI